MHISTAVAILSKLPGGDQRARSFTFKDERDTPDMYLYLRHKNVPGFTYLLFVFTQWTFLLETAAKRAVSYIKWCRTESAQRYVFL